jgi:hypothetical protein
VSDDDQTTQRAGIEVTREMVDAGVAALIQLRPTLDSPERTVRVVFQAMAARQPEPEITDDAIDDAVDFLLDFQIDRGDDPFEVTRKLVACALKGLKARREESGAAPPRQISAVP